jgi:hypothetical protein
MGPGWWLVPSAALCAALPRVLRCVWCVAVAPSDDGAFLPPERCPVGKGAFGSDTRPALPLKGAPMEPETASEPKRPKGFVRRNWGALTALILLAPLLSLRGVWVFDRTGITINDGNLHVILCDLFCIRHLSGSYSFQTPRIGTTFASGGCAIRVPLWFPFSMPVAWIAFREWRRKRAAKGKACQQ